MPMSKDEYAEGCQHTSHTGKRQILQTTILIILGDLYTILEQWGSSFP